MIEKTRFIRWKRDWLNCVFFFAWWTVVRILPSRHDAHQKQDLHRIMVTCLILFEAFKLVSGSALEFIW